MSSDYLLDLVYFLSQYHGTAWYKWQNARTCSQCMLNHCLKWDKWVLRNVDQDRQWFNTLIHRRTSPQRCILLVAPSRTAISRSSEPVRLPVRYTTPGINCRDRRYKYDGRIRTNTLHNRARQQMHQITCQFREDPLSPGLSCWLHISSETRQILCCVRTDRELPLPAFRLTEPVLSIFHKRMFIKLADHFFQWYSEQICLVPHFLLHKHSSSYVNDIVV